MEISFSAKMEFWHGLLAMAMVWLWVPGASADNVRPFDQALYAQPGERVDVGDGRRFNLVCQGEGSPTVLMEAGFGESSVTWRNIQPEIAKITRVCAYDRAGLGFSDPLDEPQDVEHMVTRLHALVKAGNIDQPFILVAHSMGGLIAVHYADRYLSDLAGMVLVDPAVVNQTKKMAAVTNAYYEGNVGQRSLILECLATAKDGAMTPGSNELNECGNVTPGADDALKAAENAQTMRTSYWEALLSQHENMFSLNQQETTPDSKQLEESQRNYNALPLIILTAGNAMPDMPENEKGPANLLWMKLHDELAARSSVGQNWLVPDVGHYIQDDNPDVVIKAIAEIVEKARR